MPKNTPYLVSLDIGSTKVCALIAEMNAQGRVDVIGKGTAVHKGARKGAIIDVAATVEAIKRAAEEAELMAGVQIERAVVGVAGPNVRSFNSRQVVAVAAKNREISREDIARSLDAARSCPIPSEFEILHVLPREFVVDGQDGVSDPLGMVGSRLEADVHVVTVPVATTQNLLNCVNRAGIEVIEMILEPLAAGAAALTPDEKELGVVLADVGGGTTEIAVWKNGALAHTSVIPVGGDHFTNDLAVVLKTPVPDAERLKRKLGTALVTLVAEDETVEIPMTGGRGVHPVKRLEVAQILQPRAEELLTLVWEEATREVPSVELRAGLVLTGGGADLDGMLEVAEQTLGVAVRRGVPHGLGGLTEVVAAPEWTCAAGLLLHGIKQERAKAPARPKKEKPGFFSRLFRTPIKELFAAQNA
ncbi:MAG TPA: cell division protein FtsA [Thermoanaerobaculia bacterium]|nr:cell division protein FtsA [Thermoanaerobaculia bacterium]